jgi:uncharacterized membrane protein (DUF373 family)
MQPRSPDNRKNARFRRRISRSQVLALRGARYAEATHNNATSKQPELRMMDFKAGKDVLVYFERAIIWFAKGLLVLLLAIAVFHVLRLLWNALDSRMFTVADVSQLQALVQRGFAAVLLLMLGLELLDSLRSYFTEHRIRLEMILIVAMIALGRHVILLDVEHLDAMRLLGISALTLALTTGYFLVKHGRVADRE